MGIHLQPRGKPAQWILHAALSIHTITLPQRVQHLASIGQFRVRLASHRLEVFLVDCAIYRGDRMHSVIIIALDVAAGGR